MNQSEKVGKFGTIVRINGRLLLATGTGIGAWALWPIMLGDWNFGLIVLMLILVTLKMAFEAFGDAIKLYSRDRAVARFLDSARPAKSARLADDADLRRAGMIDD